MEKENQANGLKDEKVKKPRIEILKKEIRLLSSKLKQLGKEKENKYKEKERIDKNINRSIKTAKDLREKKKSLDIKIRKLKDQREVLNKAIKKSFTELSGIKKELGLDKKDYKKQSASDIKKQIKALEYAVETEVLNFNREKSYMGKIKLLKAKLDEMEAEENKFKELSEFKKVIKERKTEADKVHSDIQKMATGSSVIFEQLATKSEEISGAKKQKNVIQDNLKKLKVQIDELNEKLADMLNSWSSIAPEDKKPLEKEEHVEPIQVMDKLKKKKKLTKDDILVLQRTSRLRK